MPRKNYIAILPLENALLFPNMVLPMQIYEKSYVELVEYAMNTTKKIAITLKKPGFESEPSPGTICCLGNITYTEDSISEDVDAKSVVVSGIERVKITNIHKTTPYITAEVASIPDTCSSQTIFLRCKEELPQLLIRYLFAQNVSDKDIHLANLIVDPAHIADFVAFYFIEDMYVKMSFLETTDVCERCVKIEELLRKTVK